MKKTQVERFTQINSWDLILAKLVADGARYATKSEVVEGRVRDPQMIHTLAWATLLGGAVVVLGAGYALCHALGSLRGSRTMIIASLLCYAGLAAAVVALTWVLGLSEWWLGLSAALLVGYFVAPRFIWRLSVAVHADQSSDETKEGSENA